jgi:hypothetical protein
MHTGEGEKTLFSFASKALEQHSKKFILHERKKGK